MQGKYSGSYVGKSTSGNNTMQYGVALEIKSVDGDVLKGTISTEAGYRKCTGNSAGEGTYKGNQLAFRSLDELGAAGCGRAAFKGVVEGDSLVGKWGNADVKLSK